jgi:hypothetical protein
MDPGSGPGRRRRAAGSARPGSPGRVMGSAMDGRGNAKTRCAGWLRCSSRPRRRRARSGNAQSTGSMGAPSQQQRRGDHDQQQVLDHVHEQEERPERADGREERQGQRRQATREAPGPPRLEDPPAPTPPAQPVPAPGVQAGRQHQPDDHLHSKFQERRNAPKSPICSRLLRFLPAVVVARHVVARHLVTCMSWSGISCARHLVAWGISRASSCPAWPWAGS